MNLNDTSQISDSFLLARFEDAVGTLRKLPDPDSRFLHYRSWLFDVVEDKPDVEGQEPKFRPSPKAISRMEETFTWLELLPKKKRARYKAIIIARAEKKSLREVASIVGLGKTWVKQLHMEAIIHIMIRLNKLRNANNPNKNRVSWKY